MMSPDRVRMKAFGIALEIVRLELKWRAFLVRWQETAELSYMVKVMEYFAAYVQALGDLTKLRKECAHPRAEMGTCIDCGASK